MRADYYDYGADRDDDDDAERSSESETQSEGRERDDLNLNDKLMGTLFSLLACGLASLSLSFFLFSSHPS